MLEMQDTYLSSAYLAPVQYYAKFLSDNTVFIDPYENYIKQTYRNRCTIVAANGMMSLSIPVEHSSGNKTLMKDMRISEHGNWQHIHWNAIVSAYNSTPFFEYYMDDFYPFYHNRYSFLFDFNEGLRQMIMELLRIDCDIVYTDEYKMDFASDELDLRSLISPKVDWHLNDSAFVPCSYYQVFDQKFGFIENMSIIDLLFNMGNESIIVLNKSNKDVL